MQNKTKVQVHERYSIATQTAVGCATLIVASFIKIPFFPVSFTLHTLAVFMIALIQSPKQACYSVAAYLACGSLGLPVFAGHSNMLWMAGKCGGYYVAFPLAAYLTSRLKEHYSPLFSIYCGQCLIYLLGFLWLTPFVGATNAFTKGVLLFVVSDFLKNVFVIAIIKSWRNP